MASVETDGEVSGEVDPGNMQTVDNGDISDIATSVDPDNADASELETCVDPDDQEWDFSRKSWREDLELVVEGKTLHVASPVLSLLSPVFTSMFEERFQGDGPRRIELLGKKHNDVVQFLRCLYPNICQQVTEENVFVVLPLADEFKVKQLKMSYKDFLVRVTSKPLSLNKACKYLQLTARLNMTNEKERLVKLVADFDQATFSEAGPTSSLSQELKLEVQAMQIQKIREKVTSMRVLDEEKTQHCEILANYLIYKACKKKTDRKQFRQAKLGTLNLKISNIDTFKTRTSKETTVHGIKWHFRASRKTEKGGDELSVFLHAEAPAEWNKWECEAIVKMMLLNKDTGIHHTRNFFTYTFTNKLQGGWGYPSFISMKDMTSGTKYVKNGIAELNVLFLACEPTCKPQLGDS